MKRSFHSLSLVALTLAVGVSALAQSRGPARPAGRPKITQGALMSVRSGEPVPCPLKRTDVKAEISGYLAHVTVVQDFENPYPDKIEAVYTFPLPQNAAVDDMTMLIGDRTVRGKIKRREEARAIYEAARNAGHAAALLDQERPNIFTQAVANIRPGEKVKITIRYVELLKYEDGNYEFSFPMVVGPRYSPKGLADAVRIAPPLTPPGTRAGHDISISVDLDAGVPINFLRSLTHDIDTQKSSPRKAVVQLKNKNEIPNKDFVLQYDTSGAKIEDVVMTHKAAKGGFFTLILQPPDRPRVEDVTPKEIVFVLDTSGSMMGFPIEKAKESMKLALDGLNPRDTFNLITFSGDTHVLFPKPVPATPENLSQAQSFLASRSGRGGTEMMKAIRAALDPSGDRDHVRVVCFMTDGYVGNDMEIIAEVQKHPNARVFSFGIGNSVNRFLLDKMAEAGRGEVEYVGLHDDGSAAAKRFHERVRSPLLTDIAIDWSGVPVSDVYPSRIPDMFSAKPVALNGRYSRGAKGVIKLTGKLGGKPFSRDIAVTLPESEAKHDVLATLWARHRVDDLMGKDWAGMQNGSPRGDLREEITKLGLDFNLMTQFTSLVAVEETVVTEGGRPRRVDVPVEMPNGVSYEGIFGAASEGEMAVGKMAMNRQAVLGGYGSGGGGMRPGTPPPVRTLPAPAPAPSYDLASVRQSARKLDPSLVAMIGKKTGKVDVQIWLSDTSEATLKQLKALGFEVTATPASGKVAVGRAPVEKLQALSEVAAVRYISPRL
ncbi:MAG: VIT and vWA domain-containing protein [Bryobacteraceae bacterium]